MSTAGGKEAGRRRKVKTCVGQIAISSKQAVRLKLAQGSRISPHLQKCCLLLVGNESFMNAEKDIQILTGIKIAHSTQHRLINSYQLPEPIGSKKAKSLSVLKRLS
ncbi:MAG: hypothetical protein ACRC1Z_04355 [Waterburya sp.]